jgi:hypothetical protein
MIIARRNVLRSLLVTPAIVAIDRLMPVKLFKLPTLATITREFILTTHIGICQADPLLALLHANKEREIKW